MGNAAEQLNDEDKIVHDVALIHVRLIDTRNLKLISGLDLIRYPSVLLIHTYEFQY